MRDPIQMFKNDQDRLKEPNYAKRFLWAIVYKLREPDEGGWEKAAHKKVKKIVRLINSGRDSEIIAAATKLHRIVFKIINGYIPDQH